MRHGMMMKRGLAASLAVMMGVGLYGCGDSNQTGSNKGEEQRYFKTTYVENMPETFGEGDINGNTIFKGDTFYYSNRNWETEKSGLYALNILTSEQSMIWESANDPESELRETTNLQSFAVDDEGNVYLYLNHSMLDEASLTADYSSKTLDDVIDYMTENWGYDEESARKDWDSYYAEDYGEDYGKFFKEMDAQWVNTYSVEKLDKSGNTVYTADLGGDAPDSDMGNASCYGMAADADGNLCMFMNTWSESSDDYFVRILGANGEDAGKINLQGWASKIFTLIDGRVALTAWGDNGVELQILDIAGKKVAETKTFAGQENMIPLDDTHMLYSDGSTLWSYNMEDDTKEKYLSWMDCNISSSTVMSYGVLSDGTLGVFTQRWNQSNNTNDCDIAVVKEVDASEVGDITTINIACLWLDSAIEEKAIEFNKKHDDYRLSITTYYDNGLEYEDALNAYTTAVASDTSIDIVIFNDYAQVQNYASKGLLIDMYELLDADSELKREDFLQNILAACEYDGKLVTLPRRFSLQTVVGKTEDVGPEPGWTLDEMKALLASKPEGTELFYGMTRENALRMCLSLGYNDFINSEEASCSFNSQEFIDVLEFASMFPEEFVWQEGVDETVLMNTGKVLLTQYYLGRFEEIQMYRTIFNGDLTYIGYPTSTGNGAMLNLENMYGITKNCEAKEAAWEFLRQFYLPEEKEDDGNGAMMMGYGFSVRQDEFDAFCEAAMKENENNGGSWGWGSFEVELQPSTQEDVDAVRDLVANTTAVYGAVSNDIMNIINEETAAYFAGQKSAEDVAAIIQSRMEIYLKETK